MVDESEITQAFDAEPVWRIVPAADQDGFDGGFVRWDADGETWGETVEELKGEMK